MQVTSYSFKYTHLLSYCYVNIIRAAVLFFVIKLVAEMIRASNKKIEATGIASMYPKQHCLFY